jgi:hypothetical protein
MPQINVQLSEYLNLLRKTFYINEEIKNDMSESYIDKPFLVKSLNLRDELRPNWDSLIYDLKKLPKSRIRDFTEGGWRHSYNCLFMYRNLIEESCGLVVSICVPLKTFGFYFYKFLRDTESTFKKIESYNPLDLEMKAKEGMLVKLVLSHFGKFKPFDSSYAEYKILRAAIDMSINENIDLWQVSFTKNMGILM